MLLLLLMSLLYGFGIHAARACAHALVVVAQTASPANDPPCHDGDIDVAGAACGTHCNTDTQTGRLSVSFDFPAAAPMEIGPSLAPPAPIGPLAFDAGPPRGDTGPPLHILLHRLLR